MTETEIRRLATHGAALEISRLERRLGELRAEFPNTNGAIVEGLDAPVTTHFDDHLNATIRKRRSAGVGAALRREAAASAREARAETHPIRKRKPISAAHKKAIARAQRARWRRVKNGNA